MYIILLNIGFLLLLLIIAPFSPKLVAGLFERIMGYREVKNPIPKKVGNVITIEYSKN